MNAGTKTEAIRNQELAAYHYAKAQREMLAPRQWYEETEAAEHIEHARRWARRYAMVSLSILCDPL